jgi:hypothetical protein
MTAESSSISVDTIVTISVPCYLSNISTFFILLRDGRQFEASCARTLGWLADELGGMSERLLVSADRDVLQQQVDHHEVIYHILTSNPVTDGTVPQGYSVLYVISVFTLCQSVCWRSLD